MKTRTPVLAALTLATASLCAQASVVLTVNGNGKLVGASGVEVAGTLYDVAFSDLSCAALLNGCNGPEDFTFKTQAEASDAAQALLDQVFQGGFFDFRNKVPGCTGALACGVIVAYEFLVNPTFGDGFASMLANYTSVNNRVVAAQSYLQNDLGFNFNRSFSVWTATGPADTQGLPEPSSLALAGLALAAVAGRRVKAAGRTEPSRAA